MFEIGKRISGAKREETQRVPEQEMAATPAPQPAASQAAAPARRAEAAVIGPSIHIDGNLRGEEDLIIDGEVNGTVELKNNGLTIGKHGRVKADVYAHTLRVEGSVEGNLYASELVAIRNSAQVKGNVVSPRVNLEDGARFKGSIEMDSDAVEAALGVSRASKTGASAGSGKKVGPDDFTRQPDPGSSGANNTNSGKNPGASDYSKLSTADAAR